MRKNWKVFVLLVWVLFPSLLANSTMDLSKMDSSLQWTDNRWLDDLFILQVRRRRYYCWVVLSFSVGGKHHILGKRKTTLASSINTQDESTLPSLNPSPPPSLPSSGVGILTSSKYYQRSPYSKVGFNQSPRMSAPSRHPFLPKTYNQTATSTTTATTTTTTFSSSSSSPPPPVSTSSTHDLPPVLTGKQLATLLSPSLIHSLHLPSSEPPSQHILSQRLALEMAHPDVPLPPLPSPLPSPTSLPSCKKPNALPDLNVFELVGEIVAPHGLRGELRVQVKNQHPKFRYGNPGVLYLTYDSDTPVGVNVLRSVLGKADTMAIVKLDGIYRREQASLVKGCKLYGLAADRPKPKSGVFDSYYLLGATVRLVDYPTSANASDHLLVQNPKQQTERVSTTDNDCYTLNTVHRQYDVPNEVVTNYQQEPNGVTTTKNQNYGNNECKQQEKDTKNDCNASAFTSNNNGSSSSTCSRPNKNPAIRTSSGKLNGVGMEEGKPQAKKSRLEELRQKAANLKVPESPPPKLKTFEVGRVTRFVPKQLTRHKDPRIREIQQDMIEVTLYSEFLYLLETVLSPYVTAPYTIHADEEAAQKDIAAREAAYRKLETEQQRKRRERLLLGANKQKVDEIYHRSDDGKPNLLTENNSSLLKQSHGRDYRQGKEMEGGGDIDLQGPPKEGENPLGSLENPVALKPTPEPAIPRGVTKLFACEVCDRHVFENRNEALQHEEKCLKAKLKRIREKGRKASLQEERSRLETLEAQKNMEEKQNKTCCSPKNWKDTIKQHLCEQQEIVQRERAKYYFKDGRVIDYNTCQDITKLDPKYWLSNRKVLLPLQKDYVVKNIVPHKFVDVALAWSVFHEEIAFHK